MALKGSKIENFDELWCQGASGGLDFYVSSISVKNWIFDYSLHKKEFLLENLVPGMIQSSG